MMMEITIATMGRLMKNFDMACFVSGLEAGCEDASSDIICSGDRCAVADLLQPLNHHSLSGLQAAFNNELVAAALSDLDRLDMNLIVRINHRHLIAALQFRDCATGGEHGVGFGDQLSRAHVQTDRAEAHCSDWGTTPRLEGRRLLSLRTIQGHDFSLKGICRSVGQNQFSLDVFDLLAASAVRGEVSREVNVFLLRDTKIGFDRIDR